MGADAECALVMVGAVEFLSKPVMALVRLKDNLILPSATEVPLPSRFIFLLMGPLNAGSPFPLPSPPLPSWSHSHVGESTGLDYHEMGRSMATLLSNKDFAAAAYRATTADHIATAIADFLDDSIVLPPWFSTNTNSMHALHRIVSLTFHPACLLCSCGLLPRHGDLEICCTPVNL